MEYSRPDIVVLEREIRYCNIIDVSCFFDTRDIEKERQEGGKMSGFEMGIGGGPRAEVK